MGKHRQSKSLGSVGAFTSSENPQETPEARITELERRVGTLETLTNDVIRQLDTTASRKLGERPPRAPVVPKTKAEKHDQKQKQASQVALAASLESLKCLFGDGVKRTESEIYQQLPNLSRRRFRRLRSHLSNDGNENYDERLYYLEDTRNDNPKDSR